MKESQNILRNIFPKEKESRQSKAIETCYYYF